MPPRGTRVNAGMSAGLVAAGRTHDVFVPDRLPAAVVRRLRDSVRSKNQRPLAARFDESGKPIGP